MPRGGIGGLGRFTGTVPVSFCWNGGTLAQFHFGPVQIAESTLILLRLVQDEGHLHSGLTAIRNGSVVITFRL